MVAQVSGLCRILHRPEACATNSKTGYLTRPSVLLGGDGIEVRSGRPNPPAGGFVPSAAHIADELP